MPISCWLQTKQLVCCKKSRCSTAMLMLDTTGAGDAFFAGATIGLTYGKTLAESCEIGTRLAASTICTSGNVCPRFLPEEFGLNVAVTD